MSPSPDTLPAALAWLSAQRPAAEALLRLLVEASSHTADPAGVARVAGLVAPEREAAGLAVERLGGEGAFGPHLSLQGPAAGAPTFLVGHLDTVFPAADFAGFRAEGDRAFGPGVFDMKGGLVVLAFGLQAAHRAGLTARLPLRGLLVGDEEVGSPDSRPHLERLARGARAALCFESGRSGDLLVTRRKGVAALEVVAHGVAAHAGNEHDRGRNAIWALARFVDLAQRLTDPSAGATVNVGTIRGGTSKNTVPERAECQVDLRFLTPADGDRLEGALREAAAAAALPGTRLELRRTAWRDPLVRTEASAALAEAYGACQRAAGLGSGEAALMGGGSDACTTGALGVPSIDGLGPRGRAFHTRDEAVELDSILPKAAAFLRYLASLDA